jgi:GT2 family glycosyltransferase
MDISLVILSWNSKHHLSYSIPSLINSLNSSGLVYEIFIVDNGSTDGSGEYLSDLQTNNEKTIFPIFLNHNSGTTYSRNIAIKKAKGSYIAILDSDVEVSAGIFEHLIKNLQNDNGVGLIAPKLLYPNGLLQKSTDVFPTIGRKIMRFFFLRWIEKQEKEPVELCEVDYAISAFWLIPKNVFENVGLLDEAIFYAPEDVDYCLRIRKKGFKIVYEPKVSAVHNAQEISRGFKMNKALIEHIKGLFYYFWKHKYFLRQPKV